MKQLFAVLWVFAEFNFYVFQTILFQFLTLVSSTGVHNKQTQTASFFMA